MIYAIEKMPSTIVYMTSVLRVIQADTCPYRWIQTRTYRYRFIHSDTYQDLLNTDTYDMYTNKYMHCCMCLYVIFF